MTKRKDNEPDNKARERLNEFNRQRQAIPGEHDEAPASPKKKEPKADSEAEENNANGIKKNIKKSPKK